MASTRSVAGQCTAHHVRRSQLEGSLLETSGCSGVQTGRMQRSRRAIPLAQTRMGVHWLLPNRGAALCEHRGKTELKRRQSVVSTRRSGETPDTEGEPARAKGPQQKSRHRSAGAACPRVCLCVQACLRICDEREFIPREAFQFARRNTHKRDIVDSPPTPANATDRHRPSGRAVPSIRGAPQGRGSVWNHDGKVHAFSLQSRPILRKPNRFHPTSR